MAAAWQCFQASFGQVEFGLVKRAPRLDWKQWDDMTMNTFAVVQLTILALIKRRIRKSEEQQFSYIAFIATLIHNGQNT